MHLALPINVIMGVQLHSQTPRQCNVDWPVVQDRLINRSKPRNCTRLPVDSWLVLPYSVLYFKRKIELSKTRQGQPSLNLAHASMDLYQHYLSCYSSLSEI